MERASDWIVRKTLALEIAKPLPKRKKTLSPA
jgi:hypothetical protein